MNLGVRVRQLGKLGAKSIAIVVAMQQLALNAEIACTFTARIATQLAQLVTMRLGWILQAELASHVNLGALSAPMQAHALYVEIAIISSIQIATTRAQLVIIVMDFLIGSMINK